MRLIICRKIRFFHILFPILFNIGCNHTDSKESKILMIPLEIKIDRFDKNFHLSKAENIPALKKTYPYLFPNKFSDSVWIKRQKDSLQLLLLENVEEKFSSMVPIEENLEYVFKHLKYYFPKTKIPHVIGLINNVDYQSKTIYADSLLLISLDTYLGADHYLYEGIPKYIRQEMDIKYLSSHVVSKFAANKIPPTKDRSLLSQMIYYGKQIYLKEWILPQSSDAEKMGYTDRQIQWVIDNEVYMWQYFVEKQLLYNTDPSVSQRFLEPAPFSKFYLEIDNESPGRVGAWIGWQIVKSYMKRYPNTEISTLLNLPAQTLFSKSNYKPKR
jgi:gliding motility-associated lipoprotein GldB